MLSNRNKNTPVKATHTRCDYDTASCYERVLARHCVNVCKGGGASL